MYARERSGPKQWSFLLLPNDATVNTHCYDPYIAACSFISSLGERRRRQAIGLFSVYANGHDHHQPANAIGIVVLRVHIDKFT